MIETLHDGAIRLRSEACSFVFVRLQPGALFTAVRGVDRDAFGDAVLQLADAERPRFGKPLRWFIDAREMPNVDMPVLQRWTDWLQAQQHGLQALHVLPGSSALSMNLGIAQHQARAAGRMTVHADAASFEQAVRAACTPATLDVFRPRFDESVVVLQRDGRVGQDQRVAAPGLSYAFRPLADGGVCMTGRGDDCGAVGDAAMDTLAGWIDTAPRPVLCGIDLQHMGVVSPDRAQAWSAWLVARESRLRAVG